MIITPVTYYSSDGFEGFFDFSESCPSRIMSMCEVDVGCLLWNQDGIKELLKIC